MRQHSKLSVEDLIAFTGGKVVHQSDHGDPKRHGRFRYGCLVPCSACLGLGWRMGWKRRNKCSACRGWGVLKEWVERDEVDLKP